MEIRLDSCLNRAALFNHMPLSLTSAANGAPTSPQLHSALSAPYPSGTSAMLTVSPTSAPSDTLPPTTTSASSHTLPPSTVFAPCSTLSSPVSSSFENPTKMKAKAFFRGYLIGNNDMERKVSIYVLEK